MSQRTDAPIIPWSFRSIVFDLDGILIDTEPIFEETARRQLSRRGLAWEPVVAQAMMGTPARQAFEFFRAHYALPESVGELMAESSELFHALLGQSPATLMPGVQVLLNRLEHRRIPKAIATSSSAPYVQKVLGPHDLLKRFEFVLTCEDVPIGKPHPEVYEKAAARLGHPPSEMVVVEDSIHGVQAAKAAGARCVAVPHARVCAEHLQHADAIVQSLESPELRRLLGL